MFAQPLSAVGQVNGDHLDLDEAFSPPQSWRDGGKESTSVDVRVNGAGWIWIIL